MPTQAPGVSVARVFGGGLDRTRGPHQNPNPVPWLLALVSPNLPTRWEVSLGPWS